MKSEPVAIMSALAAVVGYMLDTWLPGAWPFLESAATFLVALSARQWVSPAHD